MNKGDAAMGSSFKTTPLRVVVFFSGSASSARYLLENDENCGEKYIFVGAFTDNSEASGIEPLKAAGVPVTIIDYKDYCQVKGVERKDMEARQEYFAQVLNRIVEKGWSPDVLMCSGFMLVITEPLISEYEGRILNVHPADLRIKGDDGKPKYVGVGSKVVRLAIEDGNPATYSTVHIITPGVDEGPIISVSDPLPVRDGVSPEQQQEEMKYACDGPAYKRAFERVTSGDFPLKPKT